LKEEEVDQSVGAVMTRMGFVKGRALICVPVWYSARRGTKAEEGDGKGSASVRRRYKTRKDHSHPVSSEPEASPPVAYTA
jgi:hypothetical protein